MLCVATTLIDDELLEGERERIRSYLDDLVRRIAPHGFPLDTQVRAGAAANEIIRDAQEDDVDLIVMATHGDSPEAPFVPMGSVPWKGLQRAPCALLLVQTDSAQLAA